MACHMNHWIQYKYRFNDDPENPDWWMDLFLTDTAFRDIIEKYKPELWRFHRRSGKDSIGHQLSLLCYMNKKKAEDMYIELTNHHSINILAEHGRMKSSLLEIMEPGIEKTSDINWSDEMQKSWPYFACGACQMIIELMDHIPKYKKPSIDSVFEIYNPLNDELEDIFTSNAAHAFIHHLSALFGYAPIQLRI